MLGDAIDGGAVMTSPWAIVVIGLLSALGGGMGGWIVKLLVEASKGKRLARADAINEWKDLVDNLQKQLNEEHKRGNEQEAQMYNILNNHAKCERENAELRGEIKLLTSDVRRLQLKSDELAPGTVMPALIVATTKGMIVSVMGGISPLLHWLPSDLIKKNIELMIPDRLRDDHRNGLARVAESKKVPDPARPILTYALTKEGQEVPVSIALSGWEAAKGVMLVSAEIRRRYSSGDTVNLMKEKQHAEIPSP
jgi:hypothetical protein